MSTLSRDKINFLVEYHPYRKHGEYNPRANENTKKIMDLKNPDASNHMAAVNHFGSLLNNSLEQFKLSDLQVVIVPSSKQNKISPGLISLLSHIKSVNYTFKTDYLVRVKDVETAHKGGDRSMQKHISSIMLERKLNTSVPVLLLDDVCTTGNTMNACKYILGNHQVKDIYCLSIGQTI